MIVAIMLARIVIFVTFETIFLAKVNELFISHLFLFGKRCKGGGLVLLVQEGLPIGRFCLGALAFIPSESIRL